MAAQDCKNCGHPLNMHDETAGGQPNYFIAKGGHRLFFNCDCHDPVPANKKVK